MKKLLTTCFVFLSLAGFCQKHKKPTTLASADSAKTQQFQPADTSKVVIVLDKDRAVQMLQVLDAAKYGLDYGTQGTPLQATQNKIFADQIQQVLAGWLNKAHPEIFTQPKPIPSARDLHNPNDTTSKTKK